MSGILWRPLQLGWMNLEEFECRSRTHSSPAPNCCPPGLLTGKLLMFSSCLCCREWFSCCFLRLLLSEQWVKVGSQGRWAGPSAAFLTPHMAVLMGGTEGRRRGGAFWVFWVGIERIPKSWGCCAPTALWLPPAVCGLSVPMETVLLWQPCGAGLTLGMVCGRQWVFVEKVYFYFFFLKEFGIIQWNPLCRWNFWAPVL